MKTNSKSVLAIVLSIAVVVSGLICMPSEEVRATDADSRVYEPVTGTVFEDHIKNKTAPTKDNYLFAGWVTTDGKVIDSIDDTDINENRSNIQAKFIPAHLAGVACQVKANTYDENVDTTELRVVSVVDGGTYQELGFNLYRRRLKSDTYVDDTVCEYNVESGTNTNPAAISERYSGLYQYKSSNDTTPTIATPEDLFGSDAEGFYFTTARIGSIPKSVYGSCIFVIRPYWVTADGTYVEGLAEYDRVSDGKNEIVNISVNLKEAQEIAAGKMSIAYDKEKFEYVSADCGRVFEEMTIQNVTEGTVKCVGNVEDITGNSKHKNDVFVNLRFKKKIELQAGNSNFAISDEAFCNVSEQDSTAKVWDVKY